MEYAAGRADVVLGFVRFDVLVLVIELDVAACHGVVSLIVVLDVVRAQPHIFVTNVHVAVGNIQISLAALRTARGKFGDAPFPRRKVGLLRV